MEPSSALHRVASVLACPVCGGAIATVSATVVCVEGHAFDVARQGYVPLVNGRMPAGDTADMVAARDRFLRAGHYDTIVDAIVERVPTAARVCVDVGGGTGYYAARVLDARLELDAVVLDSSKPALRRAARAHDRLAAVAADAWAGFPLRDGGVDVVLSVFAPRNPSETVRVLAADGVLIVVAPTTRHLGELVDAVGLVRVDEQKDDRLAKQLAAFETVRSDVLDYAVVLDRTEAVDDVLMGPSGHHADAEKIAASLSDLPDPIRATVSVTVSVLRVRRL